MLKLDEKLVQLTNYNSPGGKRGDISKAVYEYYCSLVEEWPIDTTKKQDILEELYRRYSRILKYEAGNIRIIISGHKMRNLTDDTCDKAFRLRVKLNEWFTREEKKAHKDENCFPSVLSRQSSR